MEKKHTCSKSALEGLVVSGVEVYQLEVHQQEQYVAVVPDELKA